MMLPVHATVFEAVSPSSSSGNQLSVRHYHFFRSSSRARARVVDLVGASCLRYYTRRTESILSSSRRSPFHSSSCTNGFLSEKRRYQTVFVFLGTRATATPTNLRVPSWRCSQMCGGAFDISRCESRKIKNLLYLFYCVTCVTPATDVVRPTSTPKGVD